MHLSRLNLWIGLVLSLWMARGAFAGPVLKVTWKSSPTAAVQELKVWDPASVTRLRWAQSQERDPSDGKVVSWSGVAFAEIVNHALEGMPSVERASVDLLIVKDSGGRRAPIPRAFVQKYPLIFALKRDRKDLPSFVAVMPWTSKPAIFKEGAPLELFFMNEVVELELANSRDQYGSFFLSRRTDPAAMRGEKLFVQNCAACHGATGDMTWTHKTTQESLVESLHQKVKGVPPLDERDRRSLGSYLEAYRSERKK